MLATLFAALTQEFDENRWKRGKGKQSISLVFNNRNEDMRLVGTLEPLQPATAPRRLRAYGAQACADGAGAHGRRARGRSVVLPALDPSQQLQGGGSYCHTNLPAGPTPDPVARVMLRVPIE